MTISRLIPLHIHGAFEVAIGPVLIAAPFVLGFGPAGMVVSVALGASLLAVAFATHAGEEPTFPITAHAAFDALLVVVMAVGAVALGLTDEMAAAALLGGGALCMALLASVTRYSPSRA
jgi:hypothetical protein